MNTEKILAKLNDLKDEYLIIGVSAGPDSMALLDMLIKTSKKKIVCTHINHNIRIESVEEEQYLKSYCENHNIIFESMTITTYKEKNFENEARKKRYAFYEKVMKKYHSHTLLLAHHGIDLIETILMKIIRGSNLEGYAGIKTYSKVKNYTIIRPLLYMTKEDILKYNKDNNIKFYFDKSNNDINYTRNRIRKNIIPLLTKEDSNVHLKFLTYSNELQEYYNYIEETTLKKIKENYKDNIIDITLFNNEHQFMKKNIIFYILSNIYKNKTNIIKNENISDVLNLIDNNKPNVQINLPHNIIARKEYNHVYFEKQNDKIKPYKILLKDINKVDNMVIKKNVSTNIDNNSVCRLNSNDIKLPLYIRNRKNGDYIEALGLNGKQKIKDIFIEEKIPINKRNIYPLIVDSNDNIVWIPNIKKSKYNVKKDGLYDIILTSYKESEEKNEKEKQ